MIVRAATASDLAGIAVVQAASPEASQWDPAGYLDYRCTVAEERGKIAGFLVFRKTGPTEYEILNLAVHPSSRRRGVSRQLLKSVLQQDGGKWFLEVRASNLAAIQLYETMGFRQAGKRSAYYHGPPEAAIVMTLNS